MRMQMRRFTRLTNAFSKKLDNHKWALALHYMIACTTISAGFTKRYVLPRQCKRASLDHVWSIEELVGLPDGRALGSSRRESAAHSEAVPPS